MKVFCTRCRGPRRPSLGKCPGGRRLARSRDHSSNGRTAGRGSGDIAGGGQVDSARGPPGRGGDVGAGPRTRIQHPGDLEAGPYSRGHLGQGEGFGSGAVGCWPGAEVLHWAAGNAQASPLPTLLLLRDPRAYGIFPRSAGFRVPVSRRAGLAPALQRQPLGTARRNRDAALSPKA